MSSLLEHLAAQVGSTEPISETFTDDEILFLRLAASAAMYLAREESQNEDHTETVEQIMLVGPVVLRKLNRMIDGEHGESHPFIS